MKRQVLLLPLILLACTTIFSQHSDSLKLQQSILDSIYISEVEDYKGRDKVLHAEPLYIDLIRDLGARKGEREWNIGAGIFDKNRYDEYTTLIEYEFAPIDRLGFEIEAPFSFYYPVSESLNRDSVPRNKLNSIKLASQYSFFVSEKLKTSMAIGYIHEFELVSFSSYRNTSLFTGNVYNPFLVIAKRFGNNFHSLLYTGPQYFHHFGSTKTEYIYQINTNFHYMIPGTRNFIGVEFNKEFSENDFDLTIRPQMRINLTNNILVGIVAGVPIKREKERFSSFLRIIYEPPHRVHKK